MDRKSLEKLKAALIEGRITLDEGMAKFIRAGRTDDFNERRKTAAGRFNMKCEQCGSQKDFVIVRTWQPEPLFRHRQKAYKKYEKIVGKTFGPKSKLAVSVMSKTILDWSKLSQKEQQQLYRKKRNEITEKRYGKEIDKEALISCIDEQIEYQRLKGAKRLCKTCYFNLTELNLDRCPRCKELFGLVRFKKITEETCDCCRDESIEKINCYNCNYIGGSLIIDPDESYCALKWKDLPEEEYCEYWVKLQEYDDY